MSRNWVGDGRRYSIEWEQGSWSLDFGNETPGLRRVNSADDWLVLAMSRLADVGRCDPAVFAPGNLHSVEVRFNRVEATYLPREWPGLLVRASWQPIGDDAIDLEVHLQVDSIQQARILEVMVTTRLPYRVDPAVAWKVEVRDEATALLSRDGRDDGRPPTIALPHFGDLSIRPFVGSGDGLTYLEFAEAGDVSRRFLSDDKASETALFGYHLEKGVVLRARLRGILRSGTVDVAEIDREYQRFLKEPPPLGT